MASINIQFISEKLKRARARLGLTQSDLYLKSGVSIQQIRAIEQGSTDLRLSTLIKLASALGLSLRIGRSNEMDNG